MSQEAIEDFLKLHLGEKFTAEELKKFLGLNMSIHPNLRKLRPKCRSCGGLVENTPSACVWCGVKIEWEGGVRCMKAPHRTDPRLYLYFYWYER